MGLFSRSAPDTTVYETGLNTRFQNSRAYLLAIIAYMGIFLFGCAPPFVYPRSLPASPAELTFDPHLLAYRRHRRRRRRHLDALLPEGLRLLRR